MTDRRAAQYTVQEAEFEDLIDFVSAKDLVLLPAAMFKPNPHSESTEDIAGVLFSYNVNFETIEQDYGFRP